MKKFLFCLFLITISINPNTTKASVTSAAEPPAPRSVDVNKNNRDLQKLYQEIPDLNDKKALSEYIKKRLSITKKVQMTPEELASPTSVSVVNPDKQKENQDKTLSAYEKIYNESMSNATNSNMPINANDRIDGEFYELITPSQVDKPFVPDFPYVMVKLSDDREIMAPAEEHIAYMLTTMQVETTGTINMTEEFVYVSNNEGFPQGFFRILPKYTYSRDGKKRRLDVTLKSVTVNDQEYPYKITEVGNYLYIEPEKPLNLPTGIYTYHFNYLIDRAVWYYDNFDEFYWDISARTLINVVGSANAVVILPTGSSFMAQNAVVSTRQNSLKTKRISITTLDTNAMAFADTEALAVGEDIHLFITLEKNTLLKPDLLKKYLWFVHDYGMGLFAILTLLAIFIAYKISLYQLRHNKDKTNATIRKSPALFRLINNNQFDIRSLLAEMLELVAKNIANLEKHNDTVVLIKKTDNIKNQPKSLQKFIHLLFPLTETALPANSLSKLKIKRAYAYLQKEIKKEYRRYILKLNIKYLASSFIMLICGIIASSNIAVNPWHTFYVIIGCTILMEGFLLLFNRPFKNKYLRRFIKLLAVINIFSFASWMAIYTSPFYAALIIISLWTIQYYYQEFSRRNGLLRNKIKETEEYKSYLQKNPELAVNARDFNTKAPYIYAFSLEKKYKNTDVFEKIANFENIIDIK